MENFFWNLFSDFIFEGLVSLRWIWNKWIKWINYAQSVCQTICLYFWSINWIFWKFKHVWRATQKMCCIFCFFFKIIEKSNVKLWWVFLREVFFCEKLLLSKFDFCIIYVYSFLKLILKLCLSYLKFIDSTDFQNLKVYQAVKL